MPPNKPKLPSKPLWLGAMLVSFVYFCLYLTTLPVTNVGYGDSDEFLAVAFVGGVAHPPGYPLYLLLLYLFLHLPLKGLSVAFLGHLFSALTSSLTLGLIYASSYLLSRLFRQSYPSLKSPLNSQAEPILVGLLTAATLGSSALFWQYSLIAEKTAFSGLLVALGFISFLNLLQASLKSISLWAFFSALTIGLAITHHYLLATLLFPWIFVLWQQKRRWLHFLKPTIFGLILGIGVPILILWQLNLRSVTPSWRFEPTLAGLTQHLSRSVFFGNVYAKDQVINSPFSSLSLQGALTALTQFLKLNLLGSGWWLALLLLVFSQQLTSLFQAKFGRLLIIFGLFGGLAIPAYLQWASDWGTQGIIVRQWLPSLVALALPLSIAWVLALRRLLQASQTLFFRHRPFSLLVLLLPLTCIILQTRFNYPSVNLHSFNLISERYQQILTSLPSNSLLTCYSDVSCFALLYEQTVNQLRPDVDLVPLHYQLVTPTINKPMMRGFLYFDNPYLLLDIVSWNLAQSRPVYAAELSQFYYQLYGVDIPIIYAIPEGYVTRLSLSVPERLLPQSEYSQTQSWLAIKPVTYDPYRSFLKTITARDHILNSQLYLKMDQRLVAQNELNLATNLFYGLTLTEQQEIEGLRSTLEQAQPQKEYQPGSKTASATTFLSYIPDLLAKNLRSRALRAAQAAAMVDPKNIDAHLTLAQFYQEMGDLSFAWIEYQNVLLLDPSHETALQKLSQVEALLQTP